MDFRLRSIPVVLLLLTGFLLATRATTARAEATRERAIYTRLCQQCHAADGGGDHSVGAPGIAGLPEWYVERQLVNFRSGARGTHPLDIAGTRMAPMARFLQRDDELKAVSKHVAAMKAVPAKATLQGSLVKGEQKYAICSACHGPDGNGNKELNAPKLAGQSDWYLLQQLKNFKNGARGSSVDRDPIGASMRPNAMLLDDQGMLDVVAYINALTPPQQQHSKN